MSKSNSAKLTLKKVSLIQAKSRKKLLATKDILSITVTGQKLVLLTHWLVSDFFQVLQSPPE